MSFRVRDQLPRTWVYDKKKGFISLEQPRSCFLYYAKSRLNLLTGESEDYAFSRFFEKLREQKLIDKAPGYRVCHLFYESSEYFQGQDPRPEPRGPLGIEIFYASYQPYHFSSAAKSSPLTYVGQSSPNYEDYQKGFKKIQRHLHRGDAYQVNYTWPFVYRFQQKPSAEEFLARLWKKPQNIGAFAHASWLPGLELLLVSNSPECLFQASSYQGKTLLESMPIKGTMPLKSETDMHQAWARLRNSTKERAELNMITDLVRNDLSRIELPRAKVVSSAVPLKVPGLLHQYSKVRIELSVSTKLGDVLRAVFPGGSVTGAPKKRVQQIIRSVEKSPRGFYCGSTLITGPRICAASINIRSGEYWPAKGELKLHAGGGVTLGSTTRAEFEEMHAKAESFCQLLTSETHREKYNNFSTLVF